MTLLTVFVGVIALGNLVMLIAVAVMAWSVKRLVDKSVIPTMTEVKDTVKNVNRLVDKVEEKAEHIMQIGERTASEVSGKVVATTNMVEKSVTTPIITISGIIAGITRAVEVWRTASASPHRS